MAIIRAGVKFSPVALTRLLGPLNLDNRFDINCSRQCRGSEAAVPGLRELIWEPTAASLPRHCLLQLARTIYIPRTCPYFW